MLKNTVKILPHIELQNFLNITFNRSKFPTQYDQKAISATAGLLVG